MATTTDGSLTATLTTPDGKTSGPFTTDDLDRAADRLRDEHAQLSFDLGIGRRDRPDFASLKIAGSVIVPQDLKYGQHVGVTITDHYGEVIVERSARVGYPAFKDHFDKDGNKTVERIHTVTLGA